MKLCHIDYTWGKLAHRCLGNGFNPKAVALRVRLRAACVVLVSRALRRSVFELAAQSNHITAKLVDHSETEAYDETPCLLKLSYDSLQVKEMQSSVGERAIQTYNALHALLQGTAKA